MIFTACTDIELNNDKTQEIIDFINAKYEKEIPLPVKFVVKRKTKKIRELLLCSPHLYSEHILFIAWDDPASHSHKRHPIEFPNRKILGHKVLVLF